MPSTIIAASTSAGSTPSISVSSNLDLTGLQKDPSAEAGDHRRVGNT